MHVLFVKINNYNYNLSSNHMVEEIVKISLERWVKIVDYSKVFFIFQKKFNN